MSTNPYDFDNPVRDPRMFFGRSALVKEMVDNFCAPNSHSYFLFGGRRFGKTSLLRLIERQLTERLATTEEICVVPVYIDLDYKTVQSRGAFFAYLIRRLRKMMRDYLGQIHVDLDNEYLGQLQERIEEDREPLTLFERAFVYIRNTAFPHVGALQAVLLVDETERILHQDWALELQSNLRALLSNRPKVQDHLGIIMVGSSELYRKVDEPGSPLRNILIKRFLPPLSEDETRALITQPMGAALFEPVIEEIRHQSGGHPFLTQYLMHYLWQAEASETTAETVRDIADNFANERDDFEDWCKGVGPVGEQIYDRLHQRGDWTKRRDIYEAIAGNRLDLKKALEALCYHGLVHEDKKLDFRVGAEMFRSWFEEYKLPHLTEPATIFISYAREDDQQAERLHQEMQNRGFKVWKDTHELLPGEKWEQKIKRALQEHSFVILCQSQD